MAFYIASDKYNGLQNNKFLDSSNNDFTITRTGNVAQGTFSPFSLADGQWSNYFDGTGDYIQNTSNYLIANTTSTFTAEAWIYMTATPTNDAYNIPSMLSVNCGGGNDSVNYMSFGPISSLKLKLRWFDGGQKGAVGSTTLALNTWYHVACSVNSNSISIYLNGVAETLTGDTTLTNRSGNANGFALGQTYTYANYSGYISNARVVSGTAVYTSNFTPSTTPLTAISGTSLLTCQSNRFKDNSSNNFTITRNGDTKVTAFSPFVPSAAYSASTNGGSAYFDGSGDYLSCGTAINLATSDFTAECWVYKPSFSGSLETIFAGSTNGSFSMGFSNSTTFQISFPNVGYIAQPTSTFYPNTWYHIAVSKASNVYKVFINGIQIGTSTTNTTSIASSNYNIGNYVTSQYFLGYIADFRLIVGSALYTSNFTPPTAPLTAVSGTKLLLNCVNAGIYDNAAKNDIETVGNAQISTSVKKYGTGSMYFDGTGDYLKALCPNGVLNFGSSDFTIECWVYRNTINERHFICDSRLNASSATTLMFRIETNNTVTFNTGTGSVVVTSTSTVLDNVWKHIAVTRQGSTVRLFIDGVLESTGTNSTSFVDGTGGTYPPVIVSSNFPPGNNPLNGYLDDLRITKGQALYTSNFTPPKAKLTATNNTSLLLTVKESNSVPISDYFAKISDYSAYIPLGGAQATGRNALGNLGLGSNGPTNASSPTTIASGFNWKDLKLSYSGSLSLINEQDYIYYSGGNAKYSLSPFASSSEWSSVESGLAYAVGIKTDGTMWSWGINTRGSLGLGNQTDRQTPTQIGTANNWAKISCGYRHSLALNSEGMLYGWGQGTDFRLGTIDTLDRLSPVIIGFPANSWSQVYIDGNGLKAIRSDGTLWGVGTNSYNQLGRTNGATFSSAIQVFSDSDWSQVFGAQSTFAIKTDGTMWVWGRNDVNQLGLNTTAWYSVPTKIDNSTNWKQVSIGGSYAATKTDGTLWVWGSNVWGQLGLGDTSTRSMVTQLGTLSDWNQVESGNYYKLATKTDGTLWSWGYNYYGQLGLTSVTAYVYSPVQVGTHSNWSKISVYDSSSAAIKTDGTMWVWGNNSWGQLGLNTYALSNIYTPVQVGLLNNWSDVKVGNDHMLAIKTDGTLWTWGYNNFGQLGISNGTNQIVSPTQVGNLSNWSKINSYYSSSAAINSNGELYVWGYNASYQLGQFDTTNRSIPVQFERGTYQWKKIAAGYTHSLAIQTNGTLWGLGGNQYGQLGTSNTATYSFYVQAGDSLWSEIAAGTYFSLGIQSNGTLWAWGYNNYGQIGNATTNTIYSPIQIGANLWKKVACGYANSLAIQSNGTLWSWGLNNTGQGAQSNTTTRYSPVQVGTLTDWSEVRTNVNGSTHTLALKTNGTIWTWGYNNYGELGLNTTGTYYSPVQVGTMSNWTKIGIGMNNNFAISEYGNTLWGSGKGQFTNLLSGISISLSTLYYYPSKISSEFAKSITSSECVPYALNKFTGTIIQPSDEDVPNIDTSVVWNNIDAGKYHFVGIKNDGTAWGIGHNFYGQLGTGDITYRRSLTQIGARTDWNKVYCGDYNTMLVDNSMNGWVFGGNDVYQLGLSDSTNRSSPVQITYTQVKTASISDDGSWMVDNTNNIWASGAVNTNYFGVNTINAKSSPSQVTNNSNWAFAQQTVLNGMALNSNGTLFAWGSSGAVMGVTYSAGGIFPVQVNNDTWKAFGLTQPNGSTTAVAIKTDGTLWGWGSQAVILNTTTTYSSPIQLSATSGWSKLNCGYRCALAIKTDGTLWAWGINTMGALGTGDITNRSTPTQIGLLTNWSQVVAGSRSSFAIKTNGTLWAWGNNPQGQLGLSDLTNRSSPVQVGTLSNWAQVDNQEDDTVALKTDGTLWSWGYNSLGLNTTTRFSSPVQVGSASNWTKVSLGSRRLMVINSLNELWVTGYNSNGVLGLGDITDRPVLTQVPGSWTFTSSNHGTPSYDSFFGIKTDGTMWSCGYNRGYLLGDYRSFTYPDKKSADGVYVSVATSKQNTLLTKTDGTIWAVGNNSFGVLGQINATPKFSPVQIGTINTTTKIDSKNYSAAFIFK